MVEKHIRSIFLEYHPEVIYGFTDIAYSAYAGAYQSAFGICRSLWGTAGQSKPIQ